MNKKGLATIELLGYLFAFFFIAIFLGLALYGFGLVDSVLDQDIDVGQVNLAEANAIGFGRFADAFIKQGDTIGVILIFSMVILMFGSAYFFGSKYPRFFLVIDIFILVFAFILAVYLAQAYEIYLNAVSGIMTEYTEVIPKTSTFILNLPKWVGTIGAIMMILSYAGINKEENELGVNVATA